MTCSPAQLEANRKNALRSTGPKTLEGKARSRANALKHGLCANVVVPEDAEMIQTRATAWFHTLKPQNELQDWLVDQISIYSLRIDRAERMERRLRDRKSLAAELVWDDDARLAAEVLGAKVAANPAAIVQQLRRSPAGCDWLIGRWEWLERAALAEAGWSSIQAELAAHLLGLPAEFTDLAGVGTAAEDRVALARRESEALRVRREAVEPLDEVDRALTEADLFDESHPELKRLRRYESALHTRLRWCMTQFQYESPNHRPHPDLRPSRIVEAEDKSEAKPEPAPAAVPLKVAAEGKKDQWPKPFKSWMAKPFQPPFDLRPHEIPADGSTPNIQAIAVAREVQRLEKAEAQRVARRRKLERLRA